MNGKVFYGPHNCDLCGATIVRAALEDGGQRFEVPERLLRVFNRGSEAGDPFEVGPLSADMESARLPRAKPGSRVGCCRPAPPEGDK